MKILILYSGYLPGEKYGGPVTSLYNFTNLFGDDFDIYIVTSNHDLHENQEYSSISQGWNKLGKANVLYLKDDEFNRNKYNEIISLVVPDVIYISSIFSVWINNPLIKIAKNKNIPLLLAPRGELNKDALKKSNLKKKLYLLYFNLFCKFDNMYFQATSEEEYFDITKKIRNNRTFVLENIPAIINNKIYINKMTNTLKVIFIARIISNKNLLFAIKIINRLSSNVQFDIYGPIEDEDYWKMCIREIQKAPDNIKIKYNGILDPIKSKSIYQEYDCMLFPTLFENYGQVIAESINNDCIPVISYDTTPWNDLNSVYKNLAIELANEDDFINTLMTLSEMSSNEYEELINKLREYAKNKMNIRIIKSKYINLFNKMTSNER